MDGSNFRTGRDYIDLSYLLDTSAAILLRDDDPAAKTALRRLESRPKISAVTLVELEGGVYAQAALQFQRRLRLDALLKRIGVLDFDAEMAATYGSIVERNGFNRRKIIDRMIAATALVHDLTLITCNGDDFAEIDGLELLVWPT